LEVLRLLWRETVRSDETVVEGVTEAGIEITIGAKAMTVTTDVRTTIATTVTGNTTIPAAPIPLVTITLNLGEPQLAILEMGIFAANHAEALSMAQSPAKTLIFPPMPRTTSLSAPVQTMILHVRAEKTTALPPTAPPYAPLPKTIVAQRR